MKKTLLTITAISALALGLAACSEPSVLNKAPGTYQTNTSATDANGTTTKQKSTTDVSVDANGNKTAVIKNKTTKDPRGLFNKTTSESTQTIEEKN